jgi:hypothetical protein
METAAVAEDEFWERVATIVVAVAFVDQRIQCSKSEIEIETRHHHWKWKYRKEKEDDGT